ncbi:tumor susceptibility protein [Ophiocordyceps camponoti-floridani]|uniref:Tumor susceptibility protein n=1 Tax=Ophiocordyceps camponoti-floridani TaxID=2030778 RepID=A0A8H4QAU2_9HYPO|nr:tumor susceptibility protein [Ophiocordyceps camponoti-floridani]
MPVQQHVLNWLYSVLTSEYHDVNHTYNDVARVLNRHSSLAPRTDVHTFPDGTSALLLHLSGTVPVVFRGSTYRFPLSIWVPHAYPREPPLVYVTPTQSMVVRPGQHVDPQGQVYHPYLVRWSEFWDKSTLEDFLCVLTDVFAKEPPVVSRQAPRLMPAAQSTPPPVPPLPPEMASNQPRHSTISEPQPPPPPPKPRDGPGSPVSNPPSATLPPASRYDSAPPLPPDAQVELQVQATPRPLSNTEQRMSLPAHPSHVPPYQTPSASHGPHSLVAQPPTAVWQDSWNGTVASQQMRSPPVVAAPPNILDEPLAPQTTSDTAISAPPIPPNPEKDALLRQLAETLASMRQRSRQQDESSMAGLKAQRGAMLAAMAALQSEASQLTQLSQVLTSNTKILHEALHKADGVIEGSRNHPAADMDELLVAPTVVANQLYTLVAEERALGDAIFMLGRAVERGRISPAVFAKTTRSLAREWYLKKALARKIGQGMGMT